VTLLVGEQDVTLDERPSCLASGALHKALAAIED
jgi:hypothetical protein